MSLSVRIISFIGFVCTYAVWVWLLTKIARWSQGARLLWSGQLMAATSLFGLIVFVWLLGGFWFDLPFALVWLGAAELSLLCAALLRVIVVRVGTDIRPAFRVIGAEVGQAHPVVLGVPLLASGALSLLIYPLAVAIVHFTTHGSAHLTELVLQATLLYVLLSAVLFHPIAVSALTAANLDEDSRSGLFVGYLGGLVSTYLTIAILVWSFGFPKLGTHHFSLGGSSLSWIAVSCLAGWFFLALLLPYMIGSRRGKQHRENFFVREQAWLRKLLQAVERWPSPRFSYRVDALDGELLAELTRVQAQEPLLNGPFAKSFREGAGLDEPERLPAFNSAVLRSQGSEPGEEEKEPGELINEDRPSSGTERGPMPWSSGTVESAALGASCREYAMTYPPSRYLGSLTAIRKDLMEIRESFARARSKDAKRLIAEPWTGLLRERIADVDKSIQEERRAKPPSALVAGVLLTPIVGAFFAKFGDWAWEQVTRSVH
jgi:hypothetical protein